MRRALPLVAVLGLVGCGDASPPAPKAAHVSAAPVAEAARGEREVISPEDEADQRAQTLKPQDVPLAVGATAPEFDELPEKSRTAIVFFRGEW